MRKTSGIQILLVEGCLYAAPPAKVSLLLPHIQDECCSCNVQCAVFLYLHPVRVRPPMCETSIMQVESEMVDQRLLALVLLCSML